MKNCQVKCSKKAPKNDPDLICQVEDQTKPRLSLTTCPKQGQINGSNGVTPEQVPVQVAFKYFQGHLFGPTQNPPLKAILSTTP